MNKIQNKQIFHSIWSNYEQTVYFLVQEKFITLLYFLNTVSVNILLTVFNNQRTLFVKKIVEVGNKKPKASRHYHLVLL